MGSTWGPSGANRTQVGPMLAPWTLLSGECSVYMHTFVCYFMISFTVFGGMNSQTPLNGVLFDITKKHRFWNERRRLSSTNCFRVLNIVAVWYCIQILPVQKLQNKIHTFRTVLIFIKRNSYYINIQKNTSTELCWYASQACWSFVQLDILRVCNYNSMCNIWRRLVGIHMKCMLYNLYLRPFIIKLGNNWKLVFGYYDLFTGMIKA